MGSGGEMDGDGDGWWRLWGVNGDFGCFGLGLRGRVVILESVSDGRGGGGGGEKMSSATGLHS